MFDINQNLRLRFLAGLFILMSGACIEEAHGPRTPRDEYTAEEPGEWQKIAYQHVPHIHLVRNPAGQETVRVSVPLPAGQPGHFIERIGLIDANRREIISTPLERTAKPQAILIADYDTIHSDDIKVFIKCNLHDLWTVKLSDVHEAGGFYPGSKVEEMLQDYATGN